MIRHWCALVRLPAVWTVLADVAAGFLLVAGGPTPVVRLALVLVAGVALYWAGMIANDVLDLDRDRRERPTRPLASGSIEVGIAVRAAAGLMLTGVVAASLAGRWAGDGVPATWMPAGIAVAIGCLVLLYDGPLKSTVLGPVAMGACRSGSFLLGASPMLVSADGGIVVPPVVALIALGMGWYVAGITSIGREEASGGRQGSLNTGTLLVIVGLVLVATSGWSLSGRPVIGAGELFRPIVPRIDPRLMFPLAIALVGYPTVLRAIRTAAASGGAARVQQTVRRGVLAIIPIAGCIASLGAGPWGVAVFCLVVPAYVMARRIRVT